MARYERREPIGSPVRNHWIGQRLSIIDRTSRYRFEPQAPFSSFVAQAMRLLARSERYEGGDVVMVYALKALKEAGVLDQGKYVVALIGDEEKSGSPKSISRHHLIEQQSSATLLSGSKLRRVSMLQPSPDEDPAVGC